MCTPARPQRSARSPAVFARVGLLTDAFRGYPQRARPAFSPRHYSSSNDPLSQRASPRANKRSAITATKPKACRLRSHIRDLHPIPLFSEQACVSDCSGRAFATKAMLCNFRYNCSRFLRIKLRKARFLRETLHKEFPLFSLKTGTTPFTVGFGNSAFADARLHCKPLHLTYQRFYCLALLRQNRVRSINKP